MKTFENIKLELKKITRLSLLQNDSWLTLTTDASHTVIGTTLNQKINDVDCPVNFFLIEIEGCRDAMFHF